MKNGNTAGFSIEESIKVGQEMIIPPKQSDIIDDRIFVGGGNTNSILGGLTRGMERGAVNVEDRLRRLAEVTSNSMDPEQQIKATKELYGIDPDKSLNDKGAFIKGAANLAVDLVALERTGSAAKQSIPRAQQEILYAAEVGAQLDSVLQNASQSTQKTIKQGVQVGAFAATKVSGLLSQSPEEFARGFLAKTVVAVAKYALKEAIPKAIKGETENIEEAFQKGTAASYKAAESKMRHLVSCIKNVNDDDFNYIKDTLAAQLEPQKHERATSEAAMLRDYHKQLQGQIGKLNDDFDKYVNTMTTPQYEQNPVFLDTIGKMCGIANKEVEFERAGGRDYETIISPLLKKSDKFNDIAAQLKEGKPITNDQAKFIKEYHKTKTENNTELATKLFAKDKDVAFKQSLIDDCEKRVSAELVGLDDRVLSVIYGTAHFAVAMTSNVIAGVVNGVKAAGNVVKTVTGNDGPNVTGDKQAGIELQNMSSLRQKQTERDKIQEQPQEQHQVPDKKNESEKTEQQKDGRSDTVKNQPDAQPDVRKTLQSSNGSNRVKKPVDIELQSIDTPLSKLEEKITVSVAKYLQYQECNDPEAKQRLKSENIALRDENIKAYDELLKQGKGIEYTNSDGKSLTGIQWSNGEVKNLVDFTNKKIDQQRTQQLVKSNNLDVSSMPSQQCRGKHQPSVHHGGPGGACSFNGGTGGGPPQR